MNAWLLLPHLLCPPKVGDFNTLFVYIGGKWREGNVKILWLAEEKIIDRNGEIKFISRPAISGLSKSISLDFRDMTKFTRISDVTSCLL